MSKSTQKWLFSPSEQHARKALLLAGFSTITLSYAQEYDIWYVNTSTYSHTSPAPLQTIDLNANFQTYNYFGSVSDALNTEIYIPGSSSFVYDSLPSPVNFLSALSTDLLHFHGVPNQNISIQISGQSYGTYDYRQIAPINICLDAAYDTGPQSYTISAPIQLDTNTRVNIKTSDKVDSAATANVSATVTLNGALTGTGQLIQSGWTGGLVLSGNSPNFEGRITADNLVQVTGPIKVNTLQTSSNPNTLSAPYVESNVPSLSGTPITFDVPTGQSSDWTLPVKVVSGLHDAQTLKKASLGTLIASAGTSNFENLIISAGTVQVNAASTFNSAAVRLTASPIGILSTEVQSDTTLDLNGQDIFTPLTVAGRVINTSTLAPSVIKPYGTIALQQGNTFSTGTQDLDIQSIISGSSTLTVDSVSTGQIILSGANTFSGGLLIKNSAKVKLNSTEVLSGQNITSGPAGTSSISFEDLGILDIAGKSVRNNISSAHGTITSSTGSAGILTGTIYMDSLVQNASCTVDINQDITIGNVVGDASSTLAFTNSSQTPYSAIVGVATSIQGEVSIGSGATVSLSGAGRFENATGIALNGGLDITGSNLAAAQSMVLTNLSGSGLLTIGTKNITLNTLDNSHQSSEFAGSISGTGAITLNSPYALSGDMSAFRGRMIANENLTINGTMTVLRASSLGAPLTVSSGKSVIIGATNGDADATLIYRHETSSADAHDVSLVFQGSGRLIFEEAGAGQTVAANGAMNLTGDSTLTGEIGIQGTTGRLSLRSAVSVQNATKFSAAGNAELDLYGQNFSTSNKVVEMCGAGSSVIMPKLANRSTTASQIHTLNFAATGLSDVSMSSYSLEAASGDIQINHISQGTSQSISPGAIQITGPNSIIFGSDVDFSSATDFNIGSGRLRIQGSIAGTTEIANGAYLSLENDPAGPAKSISATFSGSGALEIRNGCIDLSSANLTAFTGGLHICDEGTPSFTSTYQQQSTLILSDAVSYTGDIDLEGVLVANIASNKTWSNTIAGEGLLKKYGAGKLTLSGDISDFTGALAVYEGTVESTQTLSGDLEVFAGGTLLADLHIGQGQTTAIAGHLSGYVYNNGTLLIGNNASTMQLLDITQLSGGGNISLATGTSARIRAQSPGQNILHGVNVGAGDLYLDGAFVYNQAGAVTPHGNIYVHDGGTLHFDAGTSYVGSVNVENATLKVHGTNIDRHSYIAGAALTLGAFGVLDVNVDVINNDENTMFFQLDNLEVSGAAAKIVLRPDLILNRYNSADTLLSDEPLLKVGQLQGSYLSDLRLELAPKGMSETLSEIRLMKILQEPSDMEAFSSLLDSMANNVSVKGLYVLDDIYLEETTRTLIGSIRSCTVSELQNNMQNLNLNNSAQLSLGQNLLNTTSDNEFIQHLFSKVANLISSGETAQLKELLSSILPMVANMTSHDMDLRSNISSLNSLSNLMSQMTTMITSNKLMADSGSLSVNSAQWLKANATQQYSYANKLNTRIARAVDPGADARLENFQNLNVDGLSFSSDTTYSHQTLDSQPDQEGATQSSWGSTLNAIYKTKGEWIFGANVSTTKNKMTVDTDVTTKTMNRDDRYNTVGAMAVYQSATKPWMVSTLVTYGQHNYDSNRAWLQTTGTGDVASQATADYNANEFYMSTEAGWKMRMNDATVLKPYLGATFSHQIVDAYQETSTNVSDGAPNDYGVIVPEYSTSNWSFSIGAELIQVAKTEDRQYQLLAKAGMTTQKNTGEESTYVYAYQSAPTEYISVVTENQRYNTFDLSLGLHTEIYKNVRLSTMYTGNFSSKGQTHTALASLDYAWA